MNSQERAFSERAVGGCSGRWRVGLPGRSVGFSCRVCVFLPVRPVRCVFGVFRVLGPFSPCVFPRFVVSLGCSWGAGRWVGGCSSCSFPLGSFSRSLGRAPLPGRGGAPGPSPARGRSLRFPLRALGRVSGRAVVWVGVRVGCFAPVVGAFFVCRGCRRRAWVAGPRWAGLRLGVGRVGGWGCAVRLWPVRAGPSLRGGALCPGVLPLPAFLLRASARRWGGLWPSRWARSCRWRSSGASFLVRSAVWRLGWGAAAPVAGGSASSRVAAAGVPVGAWAAWVSRPVPVARAACRLVPGCGAWVGGCWCRVSRFPLRRVGFVGAAGLSRRPVLFALFLLFPSLVRAAVVACGGVGAGGRCRRRGRVRSVRAGSPLSGRAVGGVSRRRGGCPPGLWACSGWGCALPAVAPGAVGRRLVRVSCRWRRCWCLVAGVRCGPGVARGVLPAFPPRRRLLCRRRGVGGCAVVALVSSPGGAVFACGPSCVRCGACSVALSPAGLCSACAPRCARCGGRVGFPGLRGGCSCGGPSFSGGGGFALSLAGVCRALSARAG